ncbi:hypothetical protein [Acinetobacter tjernbergiae]|uniref:Uncharacterized protein n=1 Tax=Acinetobacter tjernbergiae DSM 14971 = CIP 107465 TaxID=1120928 RepID=V2V3N1_9GAMM|nr:hypothetical protein [Acinetobacter tjernbergiae]ESK55530.1 hypothetical protein F990_01822 [Acinetobacter tjernbergiae DSM 14971 = CIP 107465]
MKIKTNQEEQTSNMLDALLKLKRQQPTIKTRWIMLPILVLLVMYSWQQQFFTAWVLIPFIWTVIVVNQALIARTRRDKLERIEQFKIDPMFWNKLKQQYPELSLKQRRLIELGFKDYLALHVMQKQAYAMPSHAVDALWHVMLQYPIQYQQLCEQTIGRTLNHSLYDGTTRAEEQAKQLFEAWKYSCMLHGYNPSNTMQLPRLFAVDQVLGWENGQSFELAQMTKDFAKYMQSQSSSSSCGSSCSSCGGGGD